jgi:hypothetical protein
MLGNRKESTESPVNNNKSLSLNTFVFQCNYASRIVTHTVAHNEKVYISAGDVLQTKV